MQTWKSCKNKRHFLQNSPLVTTVTVAAFHRMLPRLVKKAGSFLVRGKSPRPPLKKGEIISAEPMKNNPKPPFFKGRFRGISSRNANNATQTKNPCHPDSGKSGWHIPPGMPAENNLFEYKLSSWPWFPGFCVTTVPGIQSWQKQKISLDLIEKLNKIKKWNKEKCKRQMTH